MSVLPLEMRVKIASALSEGVSMRSTERLTGVTRKTIGSLLLTLGEGCEWIEHVYLHDLTCDVLELDEVWAYVGCKEAHRDQFDPDEYGDCYTFVALDATSRAVITHLSDKRTAAAATTFAQELRARVKGKPQLTTDGWKSYLEAIESAFGKRVHYAHILKTYFDERESDDAPREDVRLSGRRVVRSVKHPLLGSPDEDRISTSYVERSNLTTRMWCRRLTRLTTCFSRRLCFLRAALALHFATYNFVRVHKALRVTPAMQLGVTDHVWSMEELVVEALGALDGSPPPCTPPAAKLSGLTEALVPGARTRAARRAEARKQKRREGAARAETTGIETARAEASGELPALSFGEGAPCVLPEPPRADQDFRWMW